MSNDPHFKTFLGIFRNPNSRFYPLTTAGTAAADALDAFIDNWQEESPRSSPGSDPPRRSGGSATAARRVKGRDAGHHRSGPYGTGAIDALGVSRAKETAPRGAAVHGAVGHRVPGFHPLPDAFQPVFLVHEIQSAANPAVGGIVQLSLHVRSRSEFLVGGAQHPLDHRFRDPGPDHLRDCLRGGPRQGFGAGPVATERCSFFPTMVPTVAAALGFLFLLDPSGPINTILHLLHLPQPLWFESAQWSKPSLVGLGLWGVGDTMIIFLAALLDVPKQLYEAADIEGAGWWQKFRNITLPMISPVIFFSVIIGVIEGFQYFTEAFVVSGGDLSLGAPQGSLLFYTTWLYQQGFQYTNMGYASALAWLLFVVVMVCTVILIKTSNRWVFYQGGFR